MKQRKVLEAVLLAIIFLFLGGIITRIFDISRERKLYVNSHHWDKISLILDQIEKNYVEDIDYKTITENTIPLILNELDPHSVYFPPQDLKKADEDLEGNFDGIGITFNIPQDTAIVMSVISGGPSERAGILSGDRILKVDDIDVAGVKINQDSLVRKMRGPSGTKVHLSVYREGETIPFDIIRAKIPVNSIDVAYMINDTTGYVKLSKFARTSYREFKASEAFLIEQGMTKLIFDLRDNTGGYLDQALLLSNEFLSDGDLIVYMEGKHRKRQDFYADGSGKCQNIAIDVLINENSASSSEIFAGAIQDNDRGRIIGRRSFGKGLVQEPINFSDNSGIRLTVARFYTPTGRCIQKPYGDKGDDYMYDILERYRHGEMTDVDSIPKNDSLKFVTPKGKVVYGGGGIIPDVFVPMDTVGVTDLLVKINRQSLQVKYAISLSDKYRKELRDVTTLPQLYGLLDKMNLKTGFQEYLKKNGINIPPKQWNISEGIIMTQLRAMVGRYSTMDDDAFYPIIADIDNVIQVAVKE